MRDTITSFSLIGVLIWYTVIYLPQTDLADFAIYQQSAAALLRGENIYSPYLSVNQGSVVLELKYLYPPFLAVVLSWFERLLDPYLVRLFWMAGALISIVISASLLSKIIEKRKKISDQPCELESKHTLPLILMFISIWPPTWDGLMWGQVNPYVLLLLCLCILADLRSKSMAAGVYLGIAAALKGSPVILVLPWILGRNWRALFGVLISGIMSVVVSGITPRGYQVITDFFQSLKLLATETVINDPFYDYSLKRVYGDEWGLALGAAIILMFILVILFIKKQGRLTGDAQIACGIPVMIALAPYVWFHHLIWLVIPIAFSYVDLGGSRGRNLLRDIVFVTYLLIVGLSLYIHVILRNQFKLDADWLKLIMPILILIPVSFVVLGERSRTSRDK